jgi:soluble P-type ATPase
MLSYARWAILSGAAGQAGRKKLKEARFSLCLMHLNSNVGNANDYHLPFAEADLSESGTDSLIYPQIDSHEMSSHLAVVFDVAGTILRMFRAAKDILNDNLLEKVITSDLIMQKGGRALVVPQIDPAEVISYLPYRPISSVFKETLIEISCSSTPVAREDAIKILSTSGAKISDIQEAYMVVAARCPSAYQTMGVIVDVDLMEISHAICTACRPFSGLGHVLQELKLMEADVYIASGDSRRSLQYLANYGFQLDRIYSVASPRRKREILANLRQRYRMVVMVGDGLNDLLALKAADLSVLTVQQDSHPLPCLFQAADEVIKDIEELPPLLRNIQG